MEHGAPLLGLTKSIYYTAQHDVGRTIILILKSIKLWDYSRLRYSQK